MSEELTLENDSESRKSATNADVAELIRKCEKLLSLTGHEALTALDLAIVQWIAADFESATDDLMDIVNDIYQQREREAALNGQPWEVLL